jgi:signal transduction histidine kinase
MRNLSLRIKIFALFAATALAIVVPTLLLIADAVERGVYERARDELSVATGSLLSQWDTRDQLLPAEARARARTEALVEAWERGNLGRVHAELRRGFEKDVVFVVDTAGEVVAGPELAGAPLRAAALGGTYVLLTRDDGAPVRFALESVASDTVPLGHIGVGVRLSAAGFNKDLNRRNTEVVFMVGDSLIDATLPDSLLEGLNRQELRVVRAGGPDAVRQIHVGQAYMASALTFPGHGLPATAVVFRPIAQELEVATNIKRSLVGIGLASLVLALVLAAVIARIVARPTQTLAEASVRMAQGDFDAPLPRAGSDEIGQLSRVFGEMRSAIADREARLRSAQAEMIHREKLAAMGRLVAQLSHEINNPIYNIQNCLEALERRGDPTDPNREFLTLAQEELSRMASLTRRLLEQSRPQSDASGPLDVNALVERVLTLASSELEERGVTLSLALKPALPTVVAHPEAIQQVLANLVANAADAMPRGGVLRVYTRADEDSVEVVIEDSGTGIADADLPHIFEAFYTTKSGVTGIGLGLFVSEGIIRGHRGRIDVQSAPGAGSRFTVRLPRETLDGSLAASVPARETAAA